MRLNVSGSPFFSWQIALDVLKAGGNAIDAAIAANAAQGLMEPVGNGIGGDLFAIVYHAATNQIVGLNGSGRSPRGQSWDEVRPSCGVASLLCPVAQSIALPPRVPCPPPPLLFPFPLCPFPSR